MFCTMSLMDLDRCYRAGYFESILTTFEASFIFLRQLGSSKNWLENRTTIGKFSLPNLVKNTVVSKVSILKMLLSTVSKYRNATVTWFETGNNRQILSTGRGKSISDV
jgi:hypothetical protein